MKSAEAFGVVYLVTNTVNGKVYVGQTTVSVSKRWAGHLREASRGGNSPLHRAIRKHGPDNFTVVVLGTAPDVIGLNLAEKTWIEEKRATSSASGYNATTGGDRGFEFTASVRAKISASVRAAYEARPELRARLSSLAQAQFSKPGAREVASERTSRLMEDPVLRERLSQAGKRNMASRPDLVASLNAYNRSEGGKQKNSESHRDFYRKNPDVRLLMSETTKERLRLDPGAYRKAVDGLKKGRELRAIKRGPWASLDLVQSFVRNRTVSEYNTERPRNMPNSTALRKVYGLTYGEIRHGHKGRWAK